ncbi:MAG: hypothetical protein KGM43_01510, partial [Planctomycetota bacterium]|nr:hypothetical protein [Planctomycetota bacterium]
LQAYLEKHYGVSGSHWIAIAKDARRVLGMNSSEQPCQDFRFIPTRFMTAETPWLFLVAEGHAME